MPIDVVRERLKWLLVVALVALGVWALAAPREPADPFAGHDPETCLACRIRHGSTDEDLRREVEAIRRLREERASRRTRP